ncbi:N-acyl-D-amino-acid deacylase family protein [Actinokineospora fastidiosa]|uniref:N-acyl-D-amino-acid deacylase n=1 Tax=Actinokineospora fastidiosa TaxID=1816 RepID=A0A918GQV6_9PSEU|nr:N-acyl-D-amino-acid deacylase [Actinokineospora fastidiosa]
MTVYKGVTVIDGTGAPAYRADVEVAEGRVARIGRVPGAGTDAHGLVLSPGFIDMHSHSDLLLLTEPAHEAKTTQGVTTEVLGQDGLSYAPVDDATLATLRTQLAGWNGNPEDFDWSWRSVAAYLDRLDQGIAVNAAYLLPHGTIRMLAMGSDDRPPTADELDRMRREVATGMTEGALGLSAGLTYSPGMYADTAELVALCEVVAAHGGYFSPHHRSYGRNALDAYAEMIAVSRASGCPLHLAHATLNFPENAGRAPELLALLDTADLTLDTYPYLPGATSLAALLPGWASAGGPEAAIARLTDPATRERIRREIEEEGSDGCHGVPVDWSAIEISGVRDPANRRHVGTRVGQASRPFELFADLLVAERLGTSCLMHVGHEDNVRAIMRHPAHTGGSDGLLVGDRPHPRAWGTFPRYLGHYVRDEGVLDLVECVHHLTGRPARRLGLADRGVVREGYAADLVLFDPDTVADRATFDQPRTPAAGIHHVLVNGVPVVEDGRPTGALPGHSIRQGTP